MTGSGEYIVSTGLFRVLLPLTLLAAVIFRYNGLSFIYLVCLLFIPLLPGPAAGTIKSHTGRYLQAVLSLSVLGLLAQAGFHIYLAATPPYGHVLNNCTQKESILRQFGFQRLDHANALHVVRLILPDVVVFIVSLVVYLSAKSVCTSSDNGEVKNGDNDNLGVNSATLQEVVVEVRPTSRLRGKMRRYLDNFGDILMTLFLVASSIAVPSVLSAVYFVSFLAIVTWWSCYKSFGVSLQRYRIVLVGFSALHITLLYLYQLQSIQKAFDPDSFTARLVGFTGVILVDCSRPWQMNFHNIQWPVYINPFFILILYHICAMQTRYYLDSFVPGDPINLLPAGSRQGSPRRSKVQRPSEQQHLIDSREGSHSYNTISEAPPESSATQQEVDGSVDANRTGQRSLLSSVFVFLMGQGYLTSIIVMLCWSVIYHSWLSFVFLVVGCLVLIVPKTRTVILHLSPLIVLYSQGLLLCQYIYGLNLKKDELPEKVNDVDLAEVGLVRYDTPMGPLALKIFFTFFFWLTLRQFMRERHLARKEVAAQQNGIELPTPNSNGQFPARRGSGPSDVLDGHDSKTVQKVGNFLRGLFVKYWIFVCGLMMMFIAIIGDVVIWRIIYMIFLLLFLLTLQLSYRLWRLGMLIFWWILIGYTMVVLLVIYTYQFKAFPGHWRDLTGLEDRVLKDIGLEQFSTTGLVTRLLVPTIFLIVIVLQVHYFHTDFLTKSELNRFMKNADSADDNGQQIEDNGQEDVEDGKFKRATEFTDSVKRRAKLAITKGLPLWESFKVMLWRFAEIHTWKIVLFTIMMVSVYNISAVTVVFMILMSPFLPFKKSHGIFSFVAMIWCGLIILAKMGFQLSISKTSFWFTNCTNVTNDNTDNGFPSPFNQTQDNAHYFGLDKTDNIMHYLKDFLVIIAVLTIEAIIKLHQRQHYLKLDTNRPKEGVVFPEIKRFDADKGIPECLKFFANFFFYKFGLEICHITSVIVISARLDGFSVIYTILLAIFMIPKRRILRHMWPVYVITLSVIFPIEFLACLGLPPGLCIGYPWDENRELANTLESWLYLPDYIVPPNSVKLIGDFFQLLFVCLQWKVFSLEKSPRNVTYEGGSNNNILKDIESNKPNPVEDFISNRMSYLCVIKSAILQYLFWVTLAILFIAGTTSISIFHLGYILGSFVVLWYGQDLFLKPVLKITRVWNGLLIYNLFVIFMKVSLQVVGCVYLGDMLNDNDNRSSALCVLVQMLNIVCIGKVEPDIPIAADQKKCVIPSSSRSMAWDAVVFAFLLFQIRIFKSHYFRYVVLELKSQNKLASRGAQLINRILMRHVEEQKEKEHWLLAKIKRKMERIKLRQARLTSRAPYITTTDDHYKVIRSGDYYMFDDDSEDDDDTSTIEAIPITSVAIGRDKFDDQPSVLTTMLHTAIEGEGMAAAVQMARKEKSDRKDKEELELVESDDADKDLTADGAGGSGDEGERSDEEQVEVEADADEAESASSWQKVKIFFSFIVELFKKGVDACIDVLNQISKHYRMVAIEIDKNKIEFKERIKRETSQEIELDESDGEALSADETTDRVGGDLRIEIAEVTDDSIQQMEADAEKHDHLEKKSRLFRLLNAIFHAAMARSDLLCYFAMVLNIMIYASFLAIPYPMSLFLWAMLSVPRPAKTFWRFVLTYTQIVIVLKYFFQFTFWPWNDGRVVDSPYWAPRILGVEKSDNYATFDLIILLSIFIHRSILKRYGLWKDEASLEADWKKVGSSRPGTPLPYDDKIVDVVDYPPTKTEDEAPPELEFSDSVEFSTERSRKKKKKQKGCMWYMIRLKKFVMKVLKEQIYSATTDVYAPMFFCDFISFFIVVFGYWGFGPPTGGIGGDVTEYLQENKIPVLFLIMLLIQFVLIIIDRALYLKKLRTGKLIFQVILVLIVHVYIFFILPAITKREFKENLPAQLWYFTKCVYFGFSSYQIRCGYPTRILGNFLTKKYNYINLFLFKGFLLIPFLLELRALMDWIWTDTTLALSNWLQMEDIYSNIYVMKCWRQSEDTYKCPRGLARKRVTKYGAGIPLLVAIIFIIWFPLLLFSFANSVFDPNPPIECEAEISLGNFQYLFKTTASSGYGITSLDYDTLKKNFQYFVAASTFLAGYESRDTRLIKLTGKSTAVWQISPPSQTDLVDQLNNTNVKDFSARFHVTFTREPKSKVPDSVSNTFSSKIDMHTRQKLASLISGTNSNDSTWLLSLFPRFMRIPTEGKPIGIKALYNNSLSNVTVERQTNGMSEWWVVREIFFGDDPLKPVADSQHLPFHQRNTYLTLVTFSDRTAPAGFSLLTGYGIIGLYVSIVFVIAQFVKSFTRGLLQTIMFEELPYVDRILKLCLDIYMVRESGDLQMEEELFAKLIFLYRSPETLIKWSKPKQS